MTVSNNDTLGMYQTTQTVDADAGLLIDIDVEIPIAVNTAHGIPATVLRGNLFRAMGSESARLPVIISMSPYGKDLHYRDFNAVSYNDVPDEVKTEYMCWETAEPTYWCAQGYAVLRIDERGFGHSPGFGDIWSKQLGLDLAESVEWAHAQPWCTGKVGLFGVSYYAVACWFAAQHQPKGLVCMLPWEGASDIYRHVSRNGGLLNDGFLHAWFPRQVSCNLYPGKGVTSSLNDAPLAERMADFPRQSLENPYASRDFYQSRVVDFSKITVPFLSVANLGNIGLHLLGNVDAWKLSASKEKWLHFVAGRHDTTMFLPEAIKLQKSFLDAYLLEDDRDGWRNGSIKPVTILLRTSGADYKDIASGRHYSTRQEDDWPLARTRYERWHLTADGHMGTAEEASPAVIEWPALSVDDGEALSFRTKAIDAPTEITGHLVARLTVSVSGSPSPTDLDLFCTVRHYDKKGDEVHYSGAIGGTVPVAKGWLRCSLRAVDDQHPTHTAHQPYRSYAEDVALPVEADVKYTVDVEIWPTNVCLSPGETLALEVSSGDTEGSHPFCHHHPEDRTQVVFGGTNRVHFGGDSENYLLVPVIPK